MEQIKQPIRAVAAKLNMRPKVFILVASVVVLAAAGGLFALLRSQQQTSNIIVQDERSDSSSLEEASENLSEEAQNTQDELEYHGGDEQLEDKPSLEIKVNGTSNSNFPNFMINTDNGQPTKSATLEIIAKGLNLSDCEVTKKTNFDAEGIPAATTKLKAQASQAVVAEDGDHTLDVACAKAGVSSTMNLRIADNQPERCKGFSFSESAVTATSVQDLSTGLQGTWRGCVTTPWVPQYEVTFVFRPDGTYDSHSPEVLDGRQMIGVYYGTDDNNPQKKYQITGFVGGVGNGKLTIYFDGSNTTVTNDLQNIKLMGSKLSFSFNHFGKYGPLNFQLERQ